MNTSARTEAAASTSPNPIMAAEKKQQENSEAGASGRAKAATLPVSAPAPRWIGRDEESNAIDQHIERAYPDACLKEGGQSQRAEVDLTAFSNEELVAMILGQRVQ